MARSLFLLFVFILTFSWPALSISLSGEGSERRVLAITLTSSQSEMPEDSSDHNQAGAENSGSSLIPLEDFIHSHTLTLVPVQSESTIYHFPDNLQEGHQRRQILPPRNLK